MHNIADFIQKDNSVKAVLLRLDLNLPISNGVVTDITRLQRSIATIKSLDWHRRQIFLCSHFGRPKAHDIQYSLRQIIPVLEQNLQTEVVFFDDILAFEQNLAKIGDKPGLYLLENTRFYPGEKSNDKAFAEILSHYGQIYVNDAFSASHRSHASIDAITCYLPSYAGLALAEELQQLNKALFAPKKPVTAIIGGAKISTKLELLKNLVTKTDNLIIGGAMANSFLAALGHDIGRSLCEYEFIDKAKAILQQAKEQNCQIILPIDVVVATQFSNDAVVRHCNLNDINKIEMILDIGPASIEQIKHNIKNSSTLIWNGPLGAFEMPNFAIGTLSIAKYVASCCKNGELQAIAGGGDTVAALAQAGVINDLTYISTAGGAFLEWIEGKELPGILALNNNKK